MARQGLALALLLSEPRVHPGTLPPRDGDSRAPSTRPQRCCAAGPVQTGTEDGCRRLGTGTEAPTRFALRMFYFILGFVVFIFRNPHAFFVGFVFKRLRTAQTGGFGALTGVLHALPVPRPPAPSRARRAPPAPRAPRPRASAHLGSASHAAPLSRPGTRPLPLIGWRGAAAGRGRRAAEACG